MTGDVIRLWLARLLAPEGYVVIPKVVYGASLRLPEGYHVHKNPVKKIKLTPIEEATIDPT